MCLYSREDPGITICSRDTHVAHAIPVGHSNRGVLAIRVYRAIRVWLPSGHVYPTDRDTRVEGRLVGNSHVGKGGSRVRKRSRPSERLRPRDPMDELTASRWRRWQADYLELFPR
jgi:hypothetical protein